MIYYNECQYKKNKGYLIKENTVFNKIDPNHKYNWKCMKENCKKTIHTKGRKITYITTYNHKNHSIMSKYCSRVIRKIIADNSLEK